MDGAVGLDWKLEYGVLVCNVVVLLIQKYS